MVSSPSDLAAFLNDLKDGEIVPCPTAEAWNEHVERISTEGRITDVTENRWYYWLEVLPPRLFIPGGFCFGEGADALRLFWFDKKSNRYLVRQLSWEDTVKLCDFAGSPLPT